MKTQVPIRGYLLALAAGALALAVFLLPISGHTYNRPSWMRIEASDTQVTVRLGWRVDVSAGENNPPGFRTGEALELVVSAFPNDRFVIPASLPDIDPSLSDYTAQSDLPCAYRDIYNHSAGTYQTVRDGLIRFCRMPDDSRTSATATVLWGAIATTLDEWRSFAVGSSCPENIAPNREYYFTYYVRPDPAIPVGMCGYSYANIQMDVVSDSGPSIRLPTTGLELHPWPTDCPLTIGDDDFPTQRLARNICLPTTLTRAFDPRQEASGSATCTDRDCDGCFAPQRESTTQVITSCADDCDDLQPLRNPLRAEWRFCADDLDNDCNGDKDCRDSACAGQLCTIYPCNFRNNCDDSDYARRERAACAGVCAGRCNEVTRRAIEARYRLLPESERGFPYDNGGTALIHEWNGVYILDLAPSLACPIDAVHTSAIVARPGTALAYHIPWQIWPAYRCVGIYNSSGRELLATGPRVLGPARGPARIYPLGMRVGGVLAEQYFEGGRIWYGPRPDDALAIPIWHVTWNRLAQGQTVGSACAGVTTVDNPPPPSTCTDECNLGQGLCVTQTTRVWCGPGWDDDPCLEFPTTGVAMACSANEVCLTSHCEPCGRAGLPCCVGRACTEGACDTEGWCVTSSGADAGVTDAPPSMTDATATDVSRLDAGSPEAAVLDGGIGIDGGLVSCGNHICERSLGEHCATCPGDCPCPFGRMCEADGSCRCPEGMGDCDDIVVGCETNLRTSFNHCGTCGHVCGAGEVCHESSCGCPSGQIVCYGRCVNPQSDTSACGGCDRFCWYPNATALCRAGRCELGACNSGFTDCDGDRSNGCEARFESDQNNCGMCGVRCGRMNATSACVAGRCSWTCRSGAGDCDGVDVNGCEADLTSSTAHCGRCGRPCAPGERCEAGECRTPSAADAGGPDAARDVVEAAVPMPCPHQCATVGAWGCVDDQTVQTCASPDAMFDCRHWSTPTTCPTGYVCRPGTPGPTTGCTRCGGSDEVCCSSSVCNPGRACDASGYCRSVPACPSSCVTRANTVVGCSGATCVYTCASGFGDCDGVEANGCETDLRIAVNHCGTCGNACPTRMHATTTCTASACGSTCDANFANCDGDAGNGCETDLRTTATHCGTCESTCAVANGAAACVANTCAVVACNTGYADCDASAMNGCETDIRTSAAHCGGCTAPCSRAHAATTCVSGTCSVTACDAGFANCDGASANGCEVELAGSVTHCGRCGNACSYSNAVGSCSGSTCSMGACVAGFFDCNRSSVDGCESNTACVCTLGQTEACYGGAPGTAGVGACRGGVHSCIMVGSSTSWGPCVGEVLPAAETCDNVDNDCDGMVDEGLSRSCYSGPSGTSGVGVCRDGAQACSAGVWGFCTGDVRPSTEVCDLTDNDCDEMVDEGCACPLNTTRPCYGGPAGTASVRPCRSGAQRCESDGSGGSVWGACTGEVRPAAEICDGVDNDCDGVTDGMVADSACSTRPNMVARCVAGTCLYTCMMGFGDCDGSIANGCEANLNADTAHCGSCANACVAASGGGATCMSGACSQTCPGMQTNCSGACRITATDVNNCGVCGRVCSFLNAAATCSNGACVPGLCNPGFANCDGDASNGCETDLRTTSTHCGSCGGACITPNGTASCMASACAVAACNSGYADCDGVVTNGCETDIRSSMSHCGGCNVPCTRTHATSVCNAGICTVTSCDTGFGNCDGVSTNGCEMDTRTSSTHCGSCANACSFAHAGASCTGSTCMMGACTSGFSDCNLTSSDGCETSGVCVCTPGRTESCYSGASGTEGVGACRAGTRSCVASASGAAWSVCAGEVRPAAEVCDNIDNDCDGVIDENLSRSCYSGPLGTAGVGLCRSGTQTCGAGTWGVCSGEVLPATEVCDGADNNCNDTPDEGIPARSCGIGACVRTVPGCNAGVAPNCTPGVPETEICANGVDDNCNSSIDESPCGAAGTLVVELDATFPPPEAGWSCLTGNIIRVWGPHGAFYESAPRGQFTRTIGPDWQGFSSISVICRGPMEDVYYTGWGPLGRPAREARIASIRLNGVELSTGASLVCNDPFGPGVKPLIPLDSAFAGSCPFGIDVTCDVSSRPGWTVNAVDWISSYMVGPVLNDSTSDQNPSPSIYRLIVAEPPGAFFRGTFRITDDLGRPRRAFEDYRSPLCTTMLRFGTTYDWRTESLPTVATPRYVADPFITTACPQGAILAATPTSVPPASCGP